ncbi:MAG: hypothetical protein ACRC8Y_15730 [Chroococcales cyanobacterium]
MLPIAPATDRRNSSDASVLMLEFPSEKSDAQFLGKLPIFESKTLDSTAEKIRVEEEEPEL